MDVFNFAVFFKVINKWNVVVGVYSLYWLVILGEEVSVICQFIDGP